MLRLGDVASFQVPKHRCSKYGPFAQVSRNKYLGVGSGVRLTPE
jgi:hypothetical protein